MWGDFPPLFTDKKRAIAEFSEGGKLERMYGEEFAKQVVAAKKTIAKLRVAAATKA